MTAQINQGEQVRASQRGRGRAALDPRGIPLKGWRDIAWRIMQAISRDRIPLTAAGVTFFMLLSLVPTLSLLVSIYGLFNSPAAVVDQLTLVQGIFPLGAIEIIEDQLVRLTSQDQTSLSLTLVGSLVVALWSASAGIKALFEAMNVAYSELETRGFIRTNLLALVFVVLGLFGVLIALFAVIVVPVALSLVPLAGEVEWLVRAVSYLILLGAVLVGLAALYRWGPSRRAARWRWISPGGLFAALSIGLMSVLFSWYAATFSNYSATYGSLGALIGMLTWLWLTMMVVILGGLLNSEVEHQTALDTTVGSDRPLGERGAFVADTVGRTWPDESRPDESRPDRDET